MAFYGNSVTGTNNTTNDVITLTGASPGRKAKIYEISVVGLGTSSAANELAVRRPDTLGVTPTNQASTPLGAETESASATCATAWTTQPVITGKVPILRLGCNSNGGVYRWVANPGQEIEVRGDSVTSQAQVSIRFATAAATSMSTHIIFEDHI